MSSKRDIIREAIAEALEGASGDLHIFVVLAKQRDTLRKHVIRFVLDFAHHRGVELERRDVIDGINELIAELRTPRRKALIA